MTEKLSRCVLDVGNAVAVHSSLHIMPVISDKDLKNKEKFRIAWMLYDKEVLVDINTLELWQEFRVIYDGKVEQLVQLMMVRRVY